METAQTNAAAARPPRKTWVPLPSDYDDDLLRYFRNHRKEITEAHRDRWIVIYDEALIRSERWQDTLWQHRDAIPVGALVMYIDDEGNVRPPSVGLVALRS